MLQIFPASIFSTRSLTIDRGNLCSNRCSSNFKKSSMSDSPLSLSLSLFLSRASQSLHRILSSIFIIVPAEARRFFIHTAFIVNRRRQSNANARNETQAPFILYRTCNGKIMFDRDFMDTKGPPLILLPMKRRVSILTANAVPGPALEFLSAI